MSDKKTRLYLFSEDAPKGQVFNLTESELEAKLDDGWAESPAELDLPEVEPEMPTEEESEQNYL